MLHGAKLQKLKSAVDIKIILDKPLRIALAKIGVVFGCVLILFYFVHSIKKRCREFVLCLNVPCRGGERCYTLQS